MEIGEKSLGVYFGDVSKRGIDSRTILFRINCPKESVLNSTCTYVRE